MEHNFEQLKAHILPLSHNQQDWYVAKREWVVTGLRIDDDWDHCPCGKEIKELCYIKNELNGNVTYVGNVCVNRFLDIDTGALFDGMKRILKDDTANANTDVIEFAFKHGYIYEQEYRFLVDTKRKRKLSEKQIAWKQKINRRIINQIVVD